VFVKPDYFLSFFFWLDVISTISLILDIQLISSEMGLNGGGGQATNTASLARAGRASRVGTKYFGIHLTYFSIGQAEWCGL
jgi:3-dehydroquinate dehydratase